MGDLFNVATSQPFDVVRIRRAIDAINSQRDLRELAHQLLSAWKEQRDVTNWLLERQYQLPDAEIQGAAIHSLDTGEQPGH